MNKLILLILHSFELSLFYIKYLAMYSIGHGVITIGVTSLNPMLDIYLPKLAKKWQKDVLGIETLMESCDVLNKLQDNSLVRFGILT